VTDPGPTPDEIERALAADRARALAEVRRLTGDLHVVAVYRLPLRPGRRLLAPDAFLLRLADGRALVLALDPANPRSCAAAARTLEDAGCRPAPAPRWARSLRARLGEAASPIDPSALSAALPPGGSWDTGDPAPGRESGF
jgi:hypothetical protein